MDATNIGRLIDMCLVLIGNYAIKGSFWALSTDWLSASTAAAQPARPSSAHAVADDAGPSKAAPRP